MKKTIAVLPSHDALKSASKIGSSSDFLTKIVRKRAENACDSSSESDDEEVSSSDTTDSKDMGPPVRAAKRKRTNSGFQSIYNENKKEKKAVNNV